MNELMNEILKLCHEIRDKKIGETHVTESIMIAVAVNPVGQDYSCKCKNVDLINYKYRHMMWSDVEMATECIADLKALIEGHSNG